MTEHVSDTELDLILSDALDASRSARVDPHLATCDACRQRLQNGARLELALYEVAEARWSAPRVALAAASALALAASLTLFVHSPASWGSAASPGSYSAFEAADASTDASGFPAPAAQFARDD